MTEPRPTGGAHPARRGGLASDPRLRGLVVQAVLALAVAGLIYGATSNAAGKLARQGIVSGFGFLSRVAGFDVSQSLIPYAAATSTYLDAFLVGLLNTLLVSAIGIVLATGLGFAVGIARLSPNFLLRALAGIYVEAIRNVPLLLQLLVWYVAVRVALPEPLKPASLGEVILVTQRGLFLPRPELLEFGWLVLAALAAGILATLALAAQARRRREARGRPLTVVPAGIGLVLGLPALVWGGLALAGQAPVAFALPAPGPYDIEGGLALQPEFAALLAGLTTYTAAFIAEIVRAGLNAVPRGQAEAASALGLGRAQTLRLVVMPQAMRVIVPPLTSQYLNLTKNSSLAVVIGYPDLVHVVMGTVLNQTNQAVEAVGITMAVYLTISLATSYAMNRYNRRVALVER